MFKNTTNAIGLDYKSDDYIWTAMVIRQIYPNTIEKAMLPEEKVKYVIQFIRSMIGAVMLVAAVAFVVFALNHPEMSFSWNNTVTYSLYGVYTIVMLTLFVVPFKKR